MIDKKILRERILKEVNALTQQQVASLSSPLNKELIQLIKERNIQVIHTYIPMNNEVNIFPTIKYALNNNIKVVAPKTLKNRQLEHLVLNKIDALENGVFGTSHPSGGKIYNGTYDLIIVPGVAFSKNGKRLGYGGGYYDTFLPQHTNSYKISVCYPIQVVEELPVEPHDILIDQLIY